jgi:hypothetical protein
MHIWHIWRVCEPTETHFGCLNCLKYRIYTPLTALCPGPAPTCLYGPRRKKKNAESYFFRRIDLQRRCSPGTWRPMVSSFQLDSTTPGQERSVTALVTGASSLAGLLILQQRVRVCTRKVPSRHRLLLKIRTHRNS